MVGENRAAKNESLQDLFGTFNIAQLSMLKFCCCESISAWEALKSLSHSYKKPNQYQVFWFSFSARSCCPRQLFVHARRQPRQRREHAHRVREQTQQK